MQHEQDGMLMGRLTLLGPTYPINLVFVTHEMGDKRLPDQHDKDAKVRQANGKKKNEEIISTHSWLNDHQSFFASTQ